MTGALKVLVTPATGQQGGHLVREQEWPRAAGATTSPQIVA